MIALSIALFALGFQVRDGWPSFKNLQAGLVGTRFEWSYHLSTQYARVSGALLCGLGAVPSGGSFAAMVFGGILVGYYTDSRHGESAGVDTPAAVLDSFISGITSLVPLALALTWYRHSLWLMALVLVGLGKPAIWKLAWLSNCQRLGWFWEPTRIAAMVFGAAIGLAVALIA